MSYTENYGLPKMPTSLTDPAAVYNAAVDMIERGRTRLCTATGTIIKGHAVTMLSDGKYKHAELGEQLHGVAASDAADGTQFFAICDVGVEITLDYASFTVGGSVYVGVGGELVQTAAGFGRLGVATAANKVVLLSSGLIDLNDFESIMSASSTIHLIQSDISSRVKSEELEGLVNTILVGHGLITE